MVLHYRSASTPKVSVDTVFGVDAQKGASSGSNVSDALYSTLSTVDNIDVNYLNETKDNFTGFYLQIFITPFLSHIVTRKENLKA